jgi:hypothetical protein
MLLEILQIVNPERSSDLDHGIKGLLLKAPRADIFTAPGRQAAVASRLRSKL